MASEAAGAGEWRIAPGDLADPRIIDLLHVHVAASQAVSPPESCHALDLSGLRRPEISFWALWEGDALLGVGALMDRGRRGMAS